MKNLKQFRMFFTIGLNLFCVSIYAMDKYSAIALPENFGIGMYEGTFLDKNFCDTFNNVIQHSLNNQGQVAGYVGNLKLIPNCAYNSGGGRNVLPDKLILTSEQAALWDAKKGVNICPLSCGCSFATAVNDFGLVAVVIYQNGRPFPTSMNTVLWNSNTNELTYGPNGIPLAISNNGVVLIKIDLKPVGNYILWNSNDNTMTNINTAVPLTGLTEDGNPCSEIPSPSDELHSKNYLHFSWSDGNLKWFYDGKYHFLSAQNLAARLNCKKGVVVAVENTKIVKWHKNGKKTISAESYGACCVSGFSDSGKILLNSGVFGHCILLTPNA